MIGCLLIIIIFFLCTIYLYVYFDVMLHSKAIRQSKAKQQQSINTAQPMLCQNNLILINSLRIIHLSNSPLLCYELGKIIFCTYMCTTPFLFVDFMRIYLFRCCMLCFHFFSAAFLISLNFIIVTYHHSNIISYCVSQI